MKEEWANLLKRIEEKSGDICAYIECFSDNSGRIIAANVTIEFDSEEEFVKKANEYLLDD